MKYTLFTIIISLSLALTACGGLMFGHKWSAESISQIQNGTPREQVIKKLGKPYYSDTKNYSRSGGEARGYTDQWFHNGEELSGHRFQEHITIKYDKDLRVVDVSYTTSS